MPDFGHKSENVTVVVTGFGEARGHVQREFSIVLILTALSEVYEIIVFDQMYYTIYDYLPNLKHRLARKRLLNTVGEVWITEGLILKFQRILANVFTLVSITLRFLLANWNAQVRFDVVICSRPQTVIHMCDFRDSEVGSFFGAIFLTTSLQIMLCFEARGKLRTLINLRFFKISNVILKKITYIFHFKNIFTEYFSDHSPPAPTELQFIKNLGLSLLSCHVVQSEYSHH